MVKLWFKTIALLIASTLVQGCPCFLVHIDFEIIYFPGTIRLKMYLFTFIIYAF